MQALESRIQLILNDGLLSQLYAGASVFAVKGGRELLYAQVGCLNKEEGTAIERDSIYRIFSMTKPITSAAAMLLIERGQLSLSAPVSDFLPGFLNQRYYADGTLHPVKRPATIFDLFSMTSGLVYPGEEDFPATEMKKCFDDYESLNAADSPPSTFEMCNLIGQCPLAFSPGESWRYGTSADVLASIVEVVSGKSFRTFLQDEFFTPLNMRDTDFFVPAEKQSRLAMPYETQGGELVPYIGRHLSIGSGETKKPSFLSGGAGLASTIDDYMIFAQMLLNNGTYCGKRILSPQSVSYMRSPQLTPAQCVPFWDYPAGYSYGRLMRIRINEGWGQSLCNVGEYGWGGWLGTHFVNDPKQHLSFLFMTQRKGTNTEHIVNRLRSAIYGSL